MKPDLVARLERQLRIAIDSAHDCECAHCQQRQRDEQHDAVNRWCMLSLDEQAQWLESRDDDELVDAMRALLELELKAGFDVVAWQAALDERRWPEHR